jgi:hypothetical protein
MRNGKKLRTKGSTKKAPTQLTARRRPVREKSSARSSKNPPKHGVELPLVEAAPSPVMSPQQPLPFWSAFTIAMMRIWLGRPSARPSTIDQTPAEMQPRLK